MVEAVPGNDVLNPSFYFAWRRLLYGAFVIYGLYTLIMKKPFNLPDSNYQFWKSHNQSGKEFNLDHLQACKCFFKHPDRNESYTIYFTFSHHVFTKAQGSGLAGEIYPFPPHDIRLFDERRYELSKSLPKIIEKLQDCIFFHGGFGRFCTCEIKDTEGKTINYQVVYKVWKERGKLRFHIESAYPLDGPLGRIKKVKFWVVCYNAQHRKKLPRPPRN